MENSAGFWNNLNSNPQESHSCSFLSRKRPKLTPLTSRQQTAFVLERELRSTVAFPRAIPRPLRENIAEVLILEILLGQPYEIKDPERFIERFGAFYPLFLALKNSNPWAEMQKIAKKSRGAGIACLKLLLPLVYDLMERFSSSASASKVEPGILKEIDSEMDTLVRKFTKILNETLLLWRNGISEEFQPGNLWQEGLNPELNPELNKEKTDLSEAVLNFMQLEGYPSFLEKILDGLCCKMQEFLKEMEENLDLFETLALLFPNRDWSYSIKELKKEPFYIHLKMIKRFSTFFEQNPELKRIVDFIGRQEFEPPEDHIRDSPFGKNQIQKVRFSDSVNNILPMEAAKLLNPTLKKKFYADMLEGRLLSYQLLGKYYAGAFRIKPKGPMIVLLDSSGSMQGFPQTLAKSAVLAIAKRMLSQQRDMKIILFASTNQQLEIELGTKKRMPEKFLNFLLYTFGGGTDFNTALTSGLKALKEKDFHGADLLFITDGKSEISDKLILARLKEAKKKYNTQIYSLIIGDNKECGLSQISDYMYLVEMGPSRDGKNEVVRLIEAKTNINIISYPDKWHIDNYGDNYRRNQEC
jgi:uncharacterized protein with von Willebrand factor type A (vWA) domain